MTECPNCGESISSTVVQAISEDKPVFTVRYNWKPFFIFAIVFGVINGLGLTVTLKGNWLGILIVWIVTLLFELLIYVLTKISSNISKVEFYDHKLKAFRGFLGVREISYSDVDGIGQKNYEFSKRPFLYEKENNNLITLPVNAKTKPHELNGLTVVEWLKTRIALAEN